jgi:cell division protein FtsA
MHYINDLSYILEISKEEAFEILKKLREQEGLPEKIVTKTNHIFTIKYIKSIIDARTEDLTKFIVKTIEDSGFNGYLGKGIVITGGTSAIDDLIRKIGSETGYKVIKKIPEPIKGFERVNESNSTILGLFIKSIKDEIERAEERELEEEREEALKVEEKESIVEEREESLEEDEEILEDDFLEEKKEKKNILKPILDWLSNYI